MKIEFVAPQTPKRGALVVAVLEERKLSPAAQAADETSGGALTRAMSGTRFTGKAGQMLDVLVPAGHECDRIVLAGLGKAAEADERAFQDWGGRALAHLANSGLKDALLAVDNLDGVALTAEEAAANVALGARLRSYRFDKYRTKEPKDQKPSLKKVQLAVADPKAAQKLFTPMDKVADGVFFTRDLVSEPANILYPKTLAKEAQKLADLGVEVEVLDEKEMKKLGMGALLGVGMGSDHPPRLVVMQWKGGKEGDKPLAFIGKGVTFDSGGISIKPAANMEDMKWDMAGSGVVVGLMKALAGRKAKANVVGIVGLVENMPSAKAQRPGDIVTSMSGQTIEIINTDAEGRLVLADALWYCQDRFKPKFMVNLATLTGAIIVTFGNEIAGLFGNDDPLAEKISKAGEAVGEKVWRLPLGSAYDKLIRSDAADMKNVGGRGAGSITAAQFLQRFVNNVPWAHLDIAGVTWSKEDKPTVPKGGTAFGVRLLDRFVADNYEK